MIYVYIVQQANAALFQQHPKDRTEELLAR